MRRVDARAFSARGRAEASSDAGTIEESGDDVLKTRRTVSDAGEGISRR